LATVEKAEIPRKGRNAGSGAMHRLGEFHRDVMSRALAADVVNTSSAYAGVGALASLTVCL
jgi:hypothetical protein